jgi:DNA (cytosine-5)-methyltransferase 1
VLGRPAPHPTEPGRTGRPRLAAVFVEWLMGLPPGWVTDVPGISRSAQLRALGNGVIPAQAATAFTLLLGDVLTDHETHSARDAERGADADGNAGRGVAA